MMQIRMWVRDGMRCLVLGTCLLAVAGCTTLGTNRQIEEARRNADTDNFRKELERLNRRVASLEQSQQDLYRQLEVRKTADTRNTSRIEEHLSTLDEAVQSTGGALSRLRQEVVKDLSARMETLLHGQAGAGGGQRTESGVWHTVKTGQTLSEIAKAYNVPVNAIVRANSLKNPDSVRAGARLFIPDSSR